MRGEPDGTTSPYRAFRDSIRALLGIERADQATMAAPAGGRRRPASSLPCSRCCPSSARSPTSRRPSTPEVDAIEPRFLPDQRAAAVVRLLDRAIDDDVAIVVEDAQWTDGASDALLSRLAIAAQQRPGWSMVVLRRMVDEGFTPGGYTLQLGPMDDGEVRELLVSLSPVPLRPDEVQSLVNRAAGSPLVLDALVRLGRERGAVDDLPEHRSSR